ncbi:MAG TPA: biotin/lipoyl-containing protein [Thermoanaerobaculia bacterium]|nr:biotin/lipoyl-containing protein [Thermoanaerobaculia bacterium]
MKFIARHDENDIDVEVERHGNAYRVRIGDRWITADFVSAGRFVRSIRLEDGTQISFVHHRDGHTHHVTIGGSTMHIEMRDPLALRGRGREDDVASGGVVKALMPGRVVRVLVEKGATVRKGAGLLILEAMKMENEIVSPLDGVVDELFVEPGQTVEGGAELVHIGS